MPTDELADHGESQTLFPGLVTRLCKSCGGRYAASPSSRSSYCSTRCRSSARAARIASGGSYRKGRYLAKSGRREQYDSSLELAHMRALDGLGVRWTKSHGIRIPYHDPKSNKDRTYLPDFLLHLADGRRVLQEMKPQALVGDETVQAKARAARRWCRTHGMEYTIVTRAGQLH